MVDGDKEEEEEGIKLTVLPYPMQSGATILRPRESSMGI